MCARPKPVSPQAVQAALLAWWDASRRDMPWRGRSDPYAIWVSEVMLQQTRVETVREYYRRFLRRFPTVGALARADLDDVLKAWEGLGYYSRARNLHAAARRVASDFGGKVPGTLVELRRLEGVGAYTAGAIASIAFGLDEPVLDGNVVRVLSRLFRIGADPRTARTRKKLLALARSLIPPGQAAAVNQALMDLGATVCLPRAPRCTACPLRALCRAAARGEQDKLPWKPPRKAVPHFDIAAGVVWKRRRVLIDRRKADAMLGGLWEFPGGKRRRGETLEDAVVREVREEVGIEVAPAGRLATVRHAYTHFRITLYAFECRFVSGRCRALGCDAFRWVRPDELDRYAFPKANLRIIEALRDPGFRPLSGGRGT